MQAEEKDKWENYQEKQNTKGEKSNKMKGLCIMTEEEKNAKGTQCETIFEIVKELEAVETLEYLNKNWLYHGTDAAKHSRAKLERFRDLISLFKVAPPGFGKSMEKMPYNEPTPSRHHPGRKPRG